MKTEQKEKRERIRNLFRVLEYRQYQANIQFASHDDAMLAITARRMRRLAEKIVRTLKRKPGGKQHV